MTMKAAAFWLRVDEKTKGGLAVMIKIPVANLRIISVKSKCGAGKVLRC